MAEFIHLRVHTEYSLVDGIVRIKPLIQSVAEQQMPAVAVTDQLNLFAAVKFYKAAINHKIKPIFGADLLLENPAKASNPYLITLLSQNEIGFRNLTRLVSRAYAERLGARPMVKREWVQEAAEGNIALSGGIKGDVGQALMAKQNKAAEQIIKQWAQLFPDRYYIELQRTGRAQEAEYVAQAVRLAEQFNLPVVATNDVRFLKREDFEAHEARVCIHDGHSLTDPKRPALYSEQQYLRTPEEMVELFSDLPEALQNSIEIAKRCNVKLKLGENFLPQFPIPNNLSTEEYFIQQATAGLEQRLPAIKKENPHFKLEIYQQRLKLELDVINSMGFAGYFLIVADFIRWAKEHDIPVGPGRGSGAGSLVAYVLQITDLDPIYHQLLFERFLNPERVSMPDFDIDFCMEGRDRVIEYVTEKYGRESVSQIITFGTMAAKAVVRDVGRVLSFPYGFVDQIAKLIPFEIGMTLNKALEQEEKLAERYKHEEDVQTLLNLAKKLEGIVRNAGKHAGGVVIAPSLLTDFTPLYCEDSQSSFVSQFDKDDVEAVGLVKFDFLGLRTLTLIHWAVQTINQTRHSTGEELLDISAIPLDDAKTYQLLKNCKTTAVFQLESRGMKDLIKRLQPDCFEEIVALVALFRPGPLQSGMVDDFIARKHGHAEVKYPHPLLEPILKTTYGVILYQEQVMHIAQSLGGYTLGGADLLRRAMGKKKPEEMAKHREVFVSGCIKNNIAKKSATHIFDLMEKFAGYGFNKSHSAAYALLAYQTAWLKTHYPAEFMAAVLSSDMDNTDKVVILINDSRDIGLTLLPPDINQGKYKFTVSADKKIIYGLGAIKGVGEAAIESIVENRANGYHNLLDFCCRVDLQKVNRRTFEALIRSGSMDCFKTERSVLWASLGGAVEYAQHLSKNKEQGQHDLFSLSSEATEQSPVDPKSWLKNAVEPWSSEERLQGEKESLGYYLSGHPVAAYTEELRQFVSGSIADLNSSSSKAKVAGIITSLRTRLTKRNDKIAFLTLEDQTGSISVAVFSDAYKKYHECLIKDALIIVAGEVTYDNFTNGFQITADRITSLQQVRNKLSRTLLIKVFSEKLHQDKLKQLQIILMNYKNGSCQVCLDYTSEKYITRLELGQEWHVTVSDELIEQLRNLFGPDQVEFLY